MKYNGFYYALFQRTMKKVLTEHYGKVFAANIMRRAKGTDKKLVLEADEMGMGNPMAYNELFALAFIAPYLASEKSIAPGVVKEMMERSLYHVRLYFSRTNLNTPPPGYRRVLKNGRLYHAPRILIFQKENGGLKLLFQNRRKAFIFCFGVVIQPPKQRFFNRQASSVLIKFTYLFQISNLFP